MILGGTLEATALSERLSATNITALLSLAGRVARPKAQALPVRVGGFGGVSGLAAYLKAERITHVIDATHPFASQMSTNAVAACAACAVPLIALTRAPWQAVEGDNWQHVPDIAGAVAALNQPTARVFLGLGRMNLAAFAAVPQHHYLLRLVDPTTDTLPLPRTEIVVDRGPFDLDNDLRLLSAHRIEVIVSKNAGGTGAVAKIDAARRLGLPVIMIDRPPVPPRAEAHDVDAVLDWLQTHGADLGV